MGHDNSFADRVELCEESPSYAFASETDSEASPKVPIAKLRT